MKNVRLKTKTAPTGPNDIIEPFTKVLKYSSKTGFRPKDLNLDNHGNFQKILKPLQELIQD